MGNQQKRIRKSFIFEGERYWVSGKSELDAEIKKHDKIKELEKGLSSKESGMLFGTWMETWLRVYKSQTMNQRSLNNLTSMLQKSVAPVFGGTKLRKIKTIDLQVFLNDLAEDKSYSYVQKVKNSLEGIFGTAVDNGLLYVSPAQRLTMPSADEGHRRALTQEERETFLRACDKCGMAGLWGKVMFYTGMRPAESSDIRGSDFEIVDGQTLLHVKGTKTDAADRFVPIPSQLELPALKPNELLLHTESGKPMTTTSRRRAWDRIIRQMNIEMGCKVSPHGKVIPPYKVADDLVPYCLRHNYATMLQEKGVDIGAAAAVMGHTSTATTSRVYTHQNLQTVLRVGDAFKEL